MQGKICQMLDAKNKKTIAKGNDKKKLASPYEYAFEVTESDGVTE